MTPNDFGCCDTQIPSRYRDWRWVSPVTEDSVGRLPTTLDPVADSICKKGGTNIVIFGHSHRAELDRDSLLVDDRVAYTWIPVFESLT